MPRISKLEEIILDLKGNKSGKGGDGVMTVLAKPRGRGKITRSLICSTKPSGGQKCKNKFMELDRLCFL